MWGEPNEFLAHLQVVLRHRCGIQSQYFFNLVDVVLVRDGKLFVLLRGKLLNLDR